MLSLPRGVGNVVPQMMARTSKRHATDDGVYAETVCRPSCVESCGRKSVNLEPHISATTQNGSRSVPITQPLPRFQHRSCHVSNFASSGGTLNGLVVLMYGMWRGSAALKMGSVHGPALLPTRNKLRCSSVPHIIYLNEVTTVQTCGRLATWQTWCLNLLPFAICQARCRTEIFLQAL
jgi:hypothetical protein